MKRLTRAALFALGALTLAWAAEVSTAQNTGKKDDKGNLVDLDGLKSQAPADWKKEKPKNLLRMYQFKLPGSDEGKDDAEFYIMEQRGTVDQNLARWRDSFIPPDGKKIDDVAKVEKMKVGKGATYLDIHGTYLDKDRPLASDSTAVPRGNYRMLAVALETKEAAYVIRVIGPAKTVERYKKSFDDWLKAFK